MNKYLFSLVFITFLALPLPDSFAHASVILDHAIGGTILNAPNYDTANVPAGIGIPHSVLDSVPDGVYYAVVFFENLQGCPAGNAVINSFVPGYFWGYDIEGPNGSFSSAHATPAGGCIQQFRVNSNRAGWLWGALSNTGTANAIADANGVQAFAICDDLASCNTIVPRGTTLDPVIIVPGLLGSVEKTECG